MACCGPLHLSAPGEPSSPRTSLRVPPDFVGDTTRRLMAHWNRSATWTASGAPSRPPSAYPLACHDKSPERLGGRQPGGEGVGAAVRQQIEGPAGVHVDDDGAVGVALGEREIRRRRRGSGRSPRPAGGRDKAVPRGRRDPCMSSVSSPSRSASPCSTRRSRPTSRRAGSPSPSHRTSPSLPPLRRPASGCSPPAPKAPAAPARPLSSRGPRPPRLGSRPGRQGRQRQHDDLCLPRLHPLPRAQPLKHPSARPTAPTSATGIGSPAGVPARRLQLPEVRERPATPSGSMPLLQQAIGEATAEGCAVRTGGDNARVVGHVSGGRGRGSVTSSGTLTSRACFKSG